MNYQKNEVLLEFLLEKQPEGEGIMATDHKVNQEEKKAEGWSEILETGYKRETIKKKKSVAQCIKDSPQNYYGADIQTCD